MKIKEKDTASGTIFFQRYMKGYKGLYLGVEPPPIKNFYVPILVRFHIFFFYSSNFLRCGV